MQNGQWNRAESFRDNQRERQPFTCENIDPLCGTGLGELDCGIAPHCGVDGPAARTCQTGHKTRNNRDGPLTLVTARKGDDIFSAAPPRPQRQIVSMQKELRMAAPEL